jgi:hypothetical protein
LPLAAACPRERGRSPVPRRSSPRARTSGPRAWACSSKSSSASTTALRHGGVRADDASSIGKDYDLTLFPKASVSWLVSDEGFFPTGSFLNLFRLRAAYGESGSIPATSTRWST